MQSSYTGKRKTGSQRKKRRVLSALPAMWRGRITVGNNTADRPFIQKTYNEQLSTLPALISHTHTRARTRARTHTHTHTHTERERERGEVGNKKRGKGREVLLSESVGSTVIKSVVESNTKHTGIIRNRTK